jgi:tRNA U34 5-carboxymethylaminomethyl modifying enzyme MnmG/GidA
MQGFYANGVVCISGWPSPDFAAVMEQLTASADRLKAKDMGDVVDLLSAQARTLDALSDKMLRRAEATDSLEVFERYMRLALKAQSNSRVTLEALAKVVRGGEQTVKHVHVSEGGQAVIAGTFNHGAALSPPGEQEKSEGQSDATGAA